MLAVSWSPSPDGAVWRFKLRRGVTFNNGAVMTADDVVYTFRQLTDPRNASNALSVFQGVLGPDGVKKLGTLTIEFHLDSANGNFPDLVSSDNYNAIIVPAGTDYGKWQSRFIGTGAFKLVSFTEGSSATFAPNPHYWGPKPYVSQTSFTFYSNQQSMVIALEGGDVDMLMPVTASGANAVLNNPDYTAIKMRSANHRELSMRTDQPPFTDARVRQAVALTLNRPAMVSALLDGYGSVANDYPFGPRFGSTNTDVPQRVQDFSRAKHLLAAAGHQNGFHSTLYTEVLGEIPQLAQVIKADAAKVGIDIDLKVETQSAYYGKATFGDSDWLDGTMSLCDYGDRGVPNVFLEATLSSHGPWNAARFHNATYDKLVNQYAAALDLSTQRAIAGRIEKRLLGETPIIIPYWMDAIVVTTNDVWGVNPTAPGPLYLNRAYKS
jgi:peptide/nickel transport system substrate-binding protein